MVMADQCGVHCNFHHIMKWKMAHVHHIFSTGHQSSVVQILDKEAYKDLTGAWKDEVCQPLHKKTYLANKQWTAMLKSVFDKLKLHEFPRKSYFSQCSMQVSVMMSTEGAVRGQLW